MKTTEFKIEGREHKYSISSTPSYVDYTGRCRIFRMFHIRPPKTWNLLRLLFSSEYEVKEICRVKIYDDGTHRLIDDVCSVVNHEVCWHVLECRRESNDQRS